MTNEQAINELKDWQTAFSRMDKDMSYAIEAFDMAIEALTHFNSTSNSIKSELNELSCSAFPNRSDTIYRQDAIDAVKRNTFRLTFAEEQNCEGHVAWSAEVVYSDVMEGELLELPSVQLKPKTADSGSVDSEMPEIKTDRTIDGLIWRQDAIDALAKFVPYVIDDVSTESYTNGLTDAYILICQLPSAQLDKNSTKVDNENVDLISRQDAIDLWDKYHPFIATKAMEYDMELKALPTAQPEDVIRITGHRKFVSEFDFDEVEEDENN